VSVVLKGSLKIAFPNQFGVGSDPLFMVVRVLLVHVRISAVAVCLVPEV